MQVPTNELVWSGWGLTSASILRGSSRWLNAFFVLEDEECIRFHEGPALMSDPRFWMPALEAGRYLIEYTVISANFDDVSRTFLLEFGGSRDKVVFRAYGEPLGTRQVPEAIGRGLERTPGAPPGALGNGRSVR